MSGSTAPPRGPSASASNATYATGTSSWSAADGSLRPSRRCSARNGSTTPSRYARSSPSRTPSQSSRFAAATTSGNWPLTSLRSRLKRRASDPQRWSWTRIPSYLSSVQTTGPRRAMISAASSAGDASMNRSGRKRRRRVVPRRSSRARTAVSPMSPVSIAAFDTASIDRPNARAIAAWRSPSRSPIRSSPARILTTYVAVSASQRRSSDSNAADFAAGPPAATISANAAATSGMLGDATAPAGSSAPGWPGSGGCDGSRPARTSPTASPRSECRS